MMDEKMIEEVTSRFECFNRKQNADRAYDAFLCAIKTKKNHKIEENDVFKLLDRLLEPEISAFKKTLSSGYVLYRSRKVSVQDLSDKELGFKSELIDADKGIYNFSGYDASGSKEPPLMLSEEGRNNIKGVSYFYAADDEYTACAEVRPNSKNLVSLAKFKTLRPLQLIDFSNDVSVTEFKDKEKELNISIAKLFTRLMGQFCTQASSADDYLISQFVAEYIRKFSYDGIAYRSSQTFGINYTIFNSGKNSLKFISSKLIVVASHSYNFIDLNQCKSIVHDADFSKENDTDCERLREILYHNQSIK